MKAITTILLGILLQLLTILGILSLIPPPPADEASEKQSERQDFIDRCSSPNEPDAWESNSIKIPLTPLAIDAGNEDQEDPISDREALCLPRNYIYKPTPAPTFPLVEDPFDRIRHPLTQPTYRNE